MLRHSPLLPLLIGLQAAKLRGRSWDLLRPRPHAPTFIARVTARSNSAGNSTARLGRSGSARVPRRGSGGPRQLACPIASVGWQTGPAARRHVT